MFDNRRGEGMAVNWRGPLLAAGIFAGVFAMLLLMAHQNQSNTSDMGSSLRQDPYGTSLLFDAYSRAGYQVKRSQDEDSLSDEKALATTAFFIGSHSGWGVGREDLPSEEKILKRMEEFLARGGRVVVVDPAWKLKSETQGWEVEKDWSEKPHEAESTWISSDTKEMPPGSEKFFLDGDQPWLKTDGAWTALYSKPGGDQGKGDSPAHVYVAIRKVGNGELIAASQPWFLLNETIKTHPNPVLLDFLAGGRRVVWVDETLHGLRQGQGVLWLVQRYRLQAALLLFWSTLIILLWSMSGDLVRRPARSRDAQVMRNSDGVGVAARRLLQRSIAKDQVVRECWEEFRRRSPQDAQAISADPESGPRLRAALELPPLEGYRELNKMVAERRASAKGLARADSGADHSSTSSPKKDSQEVRLA